MGKLNRRVFCECGCGELVTWNKHFKKWNRFISGHNMKIEKARIAISIRVKGSKPWNKDLSKETDERVFKYSQNSSKTRKGKHPKPLSKEHKQKIGKSNSIKMTALWKNKEYKEGQRKSHRNKIQSEETKQKKSKANKISIKKLWDNMSAEKKSDRLSKTLKSNYSQPNKMELVILGLLDLLYPKQWKYTGNGAFWINGKNPDFVNEKLKLVIEFNGGYWHQDDIVGQREAIFAKWGYKLLEIWDIELINIERIKFRINRFMAINKNQHKTQSILWPITDRHHNIKIVDN